jgi:phosphotransacetylase
MMPLDYDRWESKLPNSEVAGRPLIIFPDLNTNNTYVQKRFKRNRSARHWSDIYKGLNKPVNDLSRLYHR